MKKNDLKYNNLSWVDKSGYVAVLAVLAFKLSFMATSDAADYIVTSNGFGKDSNYPITVPEGALVQIITHVSDGAYNANYAGPLNIQFRDGRSSSYYVRNDSHSFKLAGVLKIDFDPLHLHSTKHQLIWKIIPSTEVEDKNADYITILGSSEQVNLSETSTVELLSTTISGAYGNSPIPPMANVGVVFSSAIEAGRKISTDMYVGSVAIPFADAVMSYNKPITVKIKPMNSSPLFTITVEQSNDLSNWNTLHVMEVDGAEKMSFFRTKIVK